MDKIILVTGAAGFLGYHLVRRLCEANYRVVGLDNINNYYNIHLKCARLEQLGVRRENIFYNRICKSDKHPQFSFIKLHLEDYDRIHQLFGNHDFGVVCHLAAQVGIQHSIERPEAHISTNLVGFHNIIEECHHNQVTHLAYGSSSEVYGLSSKIPFTTKDPVSQPSSLYGMTKRSNEQMAYVYSHLHKLPTTGLRIFSTYGPWGRPDMPIYDLTRHIIEKKMINIYNKGRNAFDFTYVDDTVECMFRAVTSPHRMVSRGEATDGLTPYKLYNIGLNHPVEIAELIDILEKKLDRKAIQTQLETLGWDMKKTQADNSEFMLDYDYCPQISLESGITNFLDWYNYFHEVDL